MAANFFEQQDDARRKTGMLVFLFALAVAAIVLAIYFVFALVLIGTFDPEKAPGAAKPGLWNPILFLWVSLGTTTVIVLGSLYKTSELSAGGETVALMLGGRLIDQQTKNLAERRLLNVVEEMAIASGTPVPPVYVLDEEKSINAFAAGHRPGDAVIGVSRGSLDYLTRDELQGVMAHEFSHMLNGDMRMNLRLVGILHGILILAIIGYYVLRIAPYSSGGSRDKGGGVFLMLAIGVGLLIIGGVGLLFGKMIKAAVSREREFLADASAVQFTRYPAGIAGALKKIGGLSKHSRIEDAHADEVSHMFFSNALASSALNLLGTHPPLAKRIQRIEPTFDGKFPKVKRPDRDRTDAKRKKTKKRAGRPKAAAGPLGTIPIDPTGVIDRIGVPGLEQIVLAATIIESIPKPVYEAVHEPYGARAIVYALLLDREESIRKEQLKNLKRGAEELSYRETLRMAPTVAKLPAEARAPLVEMAFPALKRLSPKQYAAFLGNVNALVEADQKIDLFEYCIRTLLVRNLDAHFGRRRPERTRYHALTPLLEPLVNVLATLAHSGHETQEQAQRAFAAGMAQTGQSRPLVPKSECTLDHFDRSLNELSMAAPMVKKQIMDASAACIAADGKVTVREGELLRVIGAVLGCPLPSLSSDGVTG